MTKKHTYWLLNYYSSYKGEFLSDFDLLDRDADKSAVREEAVCLFGGALADRDLGGIASLEASDVNPNYATLLNKDGWVIGAVHKKSPTVIDGVGTYLTRAGHKAIISEIVPIEVSKPPHLLHFNCKGYLYLPNKARKIGFVERWMTWTEGGFETAFISMNDIVEKISNDTSIGLSTPALAQ